MEPKVLGKDEKELLIMGLGFVVSASKAAHEFAFKTEQKEAAARFLKECQDADKLREKIKSTKVIKIE